MLSLRDLIVARPETPIAEFIRRNVFTVNLDANRDEVAAMMSKYNLMALPVVDAENRLRGIITVDDALEGFLRRGEAPPSEARQLSVLEPKFPANVWAVASDGRPTLRAHPPGTPISASASPLLAYGP